MPQPKRYASDAERQAAYRRRRRALAKHPQLATGTLTALPGSSQIPGTVRWRQAIVQVQELLEMVEQEMQDYYDQRSDKWQEGDKGDSFQSRIDAIAESREKVEDLLS